jgi:hypothetical protein
MIFKRPWLVLLQFAITLVFTAGALLRVWNGVQLWGFLGELPMAVSPLFLVVTGAVWSIIGGWGLVWEWFGHRLAPTAICVTALAYTAFFWAEQFFVMISPLRRVSWPFLALFTLIALLLLFLSFRHPQVKNFYGGRYEQEVQ